MSEYVAVRPAYPSALLSALPPAETIIDLGAGTRKFTELLALIGKRIVAPEPMESMPACIPIDRLAVVEVRIDSPDFIPAPDQMEDLVRCGTGFH